MVCNMMLINGFKLIKQRKLSQRGASCAGFSLIEMTIVLSIMATLAGGALVMGNAKQATNKVDETNVRLAAIKEALVLHAKKMGYLPCPSSRTAYESASGFGVASDCSAAVVAGVTETGAGTDIVRLGAVPIRSLNLPTQYAYDGWGNRFTYMVIKNMALATGSAIDDYTTTATNNVIQVVDASGNQVQPATVDDVISFAVISHGADGRGAYSRHGSITTACDTATKDGENCDGDVVVRDMRVIDSTTTAEKYFDYVVWNPQHAVQELSVTQTEAAAAVPGSGNSVLAFDVGAYSACAIKTNHTLWCWGRNHVGQLGDGTKVDRLIPVEVSGGGSWKKIALDWDNRVCAIKMDNTLWCWGDASFGSLGNGNPWTDKTVPTAVSGGGTWKDIQISENSACGIKMDNTLWCWGSYRQMWATVSTPEEPAPGTTWKSVDVGLYNACAIKSDDTLWCVGENGYGASGHGTEDSSDHTFAEVVGGGAWKLTTGNLFGRCAIKTDESLWCWGENGFSVIGDGTTIDRNEPTAVLGGGKWQDIKRSYYYENCGLQTDGTLWCNDIWYVGSTVFVQNAGTWQHLGGNAKTFCAVKSDDTLWCAGVNDYGELGDGTTTDRSIYNFAPVSGGGSWVETKKSENFFCGLQTNQTLWCWGWNRYGRFGDGTTTDRLVPTEVAFP